MKIVHALDKLTPSIFLAGPTPRNSKTISWRLDAIKIIAEKGFEGIVYVPESATWDAHDNYDEQIRWEWQALNIATRIVFWIPRNLETMPAFTTNIEFGKYIDSGKCMLGYPKDAPKMKYLHALADNRHVSVFDNLEELLAQAIWEAEEEMREASA